ncbi:hypothetical protein TNCT_577421 [Trichonephila clavata]|uniref:Uncharacterized protein n=1 Tax=Trichonephila clavata TaxID=2740835 RepID=A0A8X6KE78_TRICU|nr:hypothetical protein TNCT_577421 [Trichonephila clavata]
MPSYSWPLICGLRYSSNKKLLHVASSPWLTLLELLTMRTYVWLEAMLVLLGTRQEISVGLHMKMWVDDVRCLPADLMTSKSREGNLRNLLHRDNLSVLQNMK